MAASADICKPRLMTDHQNVSFRATRTGLSVQTRICGNTFIFHCRGRLVFGDECAILRERVSSMLLGSSDIVVSLREVDYIDSGGIGVLIGLLVSARNRGGDLKLVAPNQHVADVLRRTNLDTIFEVYADDERAVAAIHQQGTLQNTAGNLADARNPICADNDSACS
jgi:anti-sigma B factor antagonist